MDGEHVVRSGRCFKSSDVCGMMLLLEFITIHWIQKSFKEILNDWSQFQLLLKSSYKRAFRKLNYFGHIGIKWLSKVIMKFSRRKKVTSMRSNNLWFITPLLKHFY